MSVAKWHTLGGDRILNILLGELPVDGVICMGLYTNPTELPVDAVMADIDEVSGAGYVRKTLARGHWVITGGEAVYAIQTFLAQGDWGNVGGYFLVNYDIPEDEILLATEHFTVALPIEDTKGVKITPRITVA